MFLEYYVEILKQFCNAKGYDYYNSHDEDAKKHIEEFNIWLGSLKTQLKKYNDFAAYEGINLTDYSMIELNKGIHDSIIYNQGICDNGATIVSPFASTMKLQNSKMFLLRGEPVIQTGSNIYKGQVVEERTFCTHNPYNESYINNLDVLHNNGYSVCFGTFGSIFDCDKESKLKLFSSVVERMNYKQLNISLVTDYTTIGNDYFAIAYSKIRVRENTWTR